MSTRFERTCQINADRRKVRMEPPLFGPWEPDASSDEVAVKKVIKEHIRPYIKMRAVKGPVVVICWDVREEVEC